MKLVHDPLGASVSPKKLRQTRIEIMYLPVQTQDGNVFQFDKTSEELMRNALIAWDMAGISTINWRLSNNTEIVCTKVQLQAYLDELLTLRALRGFLIDQEYIALKTSSSTERDVVNWKGRHTIQ